MGGLANAYVIRGGCSMLTVADRGEGGVKFAKILLTSYVNAPASHSNMLAIFRLYENIHQFQ